MSSSAATSKHILNITIGHYHLTLPEVLNVIAEYYAVAKDLDSEASRIERMLDAFYWNGDMHRVCTYYKEYLTQLLQVQESPFQRPDLLLTLAAAHFTIGLSATAYLIATLLVEHDKADKYDYTWFAYRLRAIMCQNIKNFDDALSNYNKALQLSRNGSYLRHNRALLYNEIGMSTAGLTDLECRAEELNELLLIAKNNPEYLEEAEAVQEAMNSIRSRRYSAGNLLREIAPRLSKNLADIIVDYAVITVAQELLFRESVLDRTL